MVCRLRQLEAEGKLHPLYPPVSLGSALKIAAAARRLNSSHGRGGSGKPTRQLRAKSALPRVNLPDQQTSGGLAPPPGALKRSNSVSGVFIDVPASKGPGRPGSAGVLVPGRTSPGPPSVVVNGVHKDGSGPVGGGRGAADPRQSSRLQVNGGGGVGRQGARATKSSPNFLQLQQNSSSSSSMDSQQSKGSGPQQQQQHQQQQQGRTATVDAQPSKSQSWNSVNGHHPTPPPDPSRFSRKPSVSTVHSRAATSHSHAPFSSHVATEKEARERGGAGEEAPGVSTTTPRFQYTGPGERSTSFLGLHDDTVDDLGEDLFAERRAELLEEEQYRAAAITKRKDRFLKDIDQYLREHPPLTATLPKPPATKKDNQRGGESGGGPGVDGLSSAMYRRRRVEFDSNPTYLPEADYREKLMGLWRDMNKCRYLRVPDEMIDLSGINTLASDTMRLFQVLKHREVDAVPGAWTEWCQGKV